MIKPKSYCYITKKCLAISRSQLFKLGNPKQIEFLLSKDHSLIIIRPVAEDSEECYELDYSQKSHLFFLEVCDFNNIFNLKKKHRERLEVVYNELNNMLFINTSSLVKEDV